MYLQHFGLATASTNMSLLKTSQTVSIDQQVLVRDKGKAASEVKYQKEGNILVTVMLMCSVFAHFLHRNDYNVCLFSFIGLMKYCSTFTLEMSMLWESKDYNT